MNKDKTIYNWKWWLVLPFALPVFILICIPKLAIILLHGVITVIEYVNVWDMTGKPFERVVNWVQK